MQPFWMSKLHKAIYCTQAANTSTKGKASLLRKATYEKEKPPQQEVVELPVGWKAHGTKLLTTHTLKFYWSQVQYLV